MTLADPHAGRLRAAWLALPCITDELTRDLVTQLCESVTELCAQRAVLSVALDLLHEQRGELGRLRRQCDRAREAVRDARRPARKAA